MYDLYHLMAFENVWILILITLQGTYGLDQILFSAHLLIERDVKHFISRRTNKLGGLFGTQWPCFLYRVGSFWHCPIHFHTTIMVKIHRLLILHINLYNIHFRLLMAWGIYWFCKMLFFIFISFFEHFW